MWDGVMVAKYLWRLNRNVPEPLLMKTCHRDIKYQVTNRSNAGLLWSSLRMEFSSHPYITLTLFHPTVKKLASLFWNSILAKISAVLTMHDSMQVDRRKLNRLPSMNRTIIGVVSKDSHWMHLVPPPPTHALWIRNRHYFRSYGAEYDRPQTSIGSDLNTLEKEGICDLIFVQIFNHDLSSQVSKLLSS
jgi:hypothetical protein